MASERMSIGVVLERRLSSHPWEDFTLRPVAVVPGAVRETSGRTLAEGEGWLQYYGGALDLELHHTETDDYRYNLANDAPAVYVVLREDPEAANGISPFAATASPFEAQTYLDADENVVEAVPMSPVIADWISAFVARYHVERPVYKRQRTPHSPRRDSKPVPPPVPLSERMERDG